MLNFAKVAAASDGAKIRAYLTKDAPEPETLTVSGVSPNGRDLETGEKLTHYYECRSGLILALRCTTVVAKIGGIGPTEALRQERPFPKEASNAPVRTGSQNSPRAIERRQSKK
jgi:hypothetical protein